MDQTSEGARRVRPRIFDTDWLMLREITRSLRSAIATKVAPGDQVLDFGCGSAPYRELVAQRGATYIGADFDSAADLEIGSGGTLPLADRSVDVVLSVQVLEHVRDLGRYFLEISRVLKPTGTLILSTHGTWLYHPHPEDHRRWTRTGLLNDLAIHGFSAESVESLVGPLGTTTMIRLTGAAFFLRRLPVLGDHLARILAVVMNMRGWLEERATPRQIRYDNGCVYLVCARPSDAAS